MEQSFRNLSSAQKKEAEVSTKYTVAFPPVFSLSNLNGVNGFVITGSGTPGDNIGFSVSGAGDINADGIDDFIIGSPGNSVRGSYVVFGSRKKFPQVFNLTDLNGENGFAINGISRDDYSGISVSGGGDINADDIDDIIIGAPGANFSTGQCQVVFGSKNKFPAVFNLTDLNGKNGFVINGVTKIFQIGSSISSSGDINADGIDDIIIGTRGTSTGPAMNYVLFGTHNEFPISFNLNNLNGTNGFSMIMPREPDTSTWRNCVVSSTDINADGIDDIIIGGVFFRSYVIFGKKGVFPATIDLSKLNGQDGFAIMLTNGSVGYQAVRGAGDINADGINDLITIGGPVQIIFGNKVFPPVLDTTTLNGKNGFTINFVDSGDSRLLSSEDVNGDGLSDVIIGMEGSNKSSYVVFGSNAQFPANFDVSSLNGKNGFAIYNDLARIRPLYAVSGAGDINADGIDDILIGSGTLYDNAGQSYVIFGQKQLAGETSLDVDTD